MSQHRAAHQRPPQAHLWTPGPEVRPSARGTGQREKGDGAGGRMQWERVRSNTGGAATVTSGAPLTTAGVAVVLGGACLIGGLIDLFLVGTAAWAITGLFLAACVYAAVKVRRQGWYSAVVGPPLAFALGLTLVALFSPHDLGSGVIGAAATMLELLAVKARAVFLGTGLALVIVLVRRLPFNR